MHPIKYTTLALLALGTSAQAHVTLETRQAPVGSFYKAVLQVPHGCNGEDTTAVRVQIPEGVMAVSPQPKAGWDITIKHHEDAPTYEFHGEQRAADVSEVDWHGHLPDAYFDEFKMVVYLTEALTPGENLYFPVVQECGDDHTARWIDQTDNHSADEPAPYIKLLPKK